LHRVCEPLETQKGRVSMSQPKSSRLSGFFKLERGARFDLLREATDLPVDQTRVLGQDGSLPFDLADLFVENAIGSFPLPLGVATNFRVNGEDVVVPMAVEESSVIAAASNAAKLVYDNGGFVAETLSSEMIGQIQILDISPELIPAAQARLLEASDRLLQLADETHPRLKMRGGGARRIEVRTFADAAIPFLVLHIHLDTREAMGANLVNTVCERLSPEVQRITGGRIGLKILSNLADHKLYRTRVQIRSSDLKVSDKQLQLSGAEVSRRIVEAFVFADNDVYRATTHNKGIMNGIDPVAIATGNDWRAIEAGAHAYAARSGRYRSLSNWSLDKNGDLVGTLEIPLQVGTVGGITRLHPLARVALQMIGNPSSERLAHIMASVGLASNLAALRALCTTGIQRGHMKLHAKNLALAAGARGKEVEAVANRLVVEPKITASAAERILAQIRSTSQGVTPERSAKSQFE
jgi:hydroxymethylglutaryl-CoA reductase